MSREKQLKRIEKDLASWQRGKKIIRQKVILAGAPIAIGLIVYTGLNTRPLYYFLAMLLGFALFLFWYSGLGTPSTWEGRVNKRLGGYDPQDTDAFLTLCRTVNENRGFDAEDIRAWIETEKAAIERFKRQSAERQRYSFTRRLERAEKPRDD